jgi:hypothetical protein
MQKPLKSISYMWLGIGHYFNRYNHYYSQLNIWQDSVYS